MKLEDYFERIYIVNLPFKQDRRIRVENQITELGLSDKITWVRGITGDVVMPPAWWKAGNGAWGCLLSHARIAQDAMMDNLSNYVVFEDDVVFQKLTGAMLKMFMRQVPSDWGQLYLGGQHLREPTEVVDATFVLRAWNVNRTHAYALRNSCFARFHQHILHAPDYISKSTGWHIDHQLGIAHERADWPVYAPLWWMAGQDADRSNISGQENPRYWWHPWRHAAALPFVHIPTDSSKVPDDLCDFLHAGNNLLSNTFQDVGLNDAATDDGRLYAWLLMIAREALDHHKIPAWQHPEISKERVGRLWSTGSLSLAEANLHELNKYPWNHLFPYDTY